MKLFRSRAVGLQRVQRWLGDRRELRLLASVTVIAVRAGIEVLTQSGQRTLVLGDEGLEEEELAAEVVQVLQSGLLEERLQELRQEVYEVGHQLVELTERLHCPRPEVLNVVGVANAA